MMDRKINFFIDEDVYEKFYLAMNLTKDSENDAIETCMKWYIAKTFEKASQDYNPKAVAKKTADESSDYYGKAIQRIPVWALKPTQYNHKINRAYFEAVAATGSATIDAREHLCRDKSVLKLYVPTFKNNYSHMKLDGSKSHGKVFEDDGDIVYIWSEVEDTLTKYKTSIYNAGDWMIYINNDNGQFYKLKTDGTDEQLLVPKGKNKE